MLQRAGGVAATFKAKDIVHIIDDYVGLGYSISKDDELKFIRAVAEKTSIVVDPVYSGKALYGLSKEIQKDPDAWKGHKILFIHTGGFFGLYPKKDQLLPLLPKEEIQLLSLN